MPSNPGIFGLDLLNTAPYGAYAVDPSQTIRSWNPGAEQILGHRARDVIGQPCYQVLQGLSQHDSTPVCQQGCPSLLHTRQGRIPPVYGVRMLCASGRRKLVAVTPMVISAAEAGDIVLVHLFHESDNHARARRIAGAVKDLLSERPTTDQATVSSEKQPLSRRELQVLRLTAAGLTPQETAAELGLSYHTVRNHMANMRRKLGQHNKLDLVRTAHDLGLIQPHRPTG